MTAQVDAVVYFYIQDPVASVLQAENARNSTYRVAQGTLRDVLGTKSLAQILSDREEISEQMGVGVALKWGLGLQSGSPCGGVMDVCLCAWCRCCWTVLLIDGV